VQATTLKSCIKTNIKTSKTPNEEHEWEGKKKQGSMFGLTGAGSKEILTDGKSLETVGKEGRVQGREAVDVALNKREWPIGEGRQRRGCLLSRQNGVHVSNKQCKNKRLAQNLRGLLNELIGGAHESHP